jgi:hypothetical protein
MRCSNRPFGIVMVCGYFWAAWSTHLTLLAYTFLRRVVVDIGNIFHRDHQPMERYVTWGWIEREIKGDRRATGQWYRSIDLDAVVGGHTHRSESNKGAGAPYAACRSRGPRSHTARVRRNVQITTTTTRQSFSREQQH